MESNIPMKWLFAGDSITHGAQHTWGWRDYTEHFSERVRWELGRKRDLIIKTGVSGSTAQAIRDDVEWSVLQFNADVVMIMIGTNDCQDGHSGLYKFRENVVCLIDMIHVANRDTIIILQTPNPILDEAMNYRGTISLYAEEIRMIAIERNLFLIDHWNYWTNAIKEKPIRKTAWLNDPVHPNHYGHLAMARLLLQELDLFDYKSNIGCLFLP